MQFKQINWLIFLTTFLIFGFYFSINQKVLYPTKLSVTKGDIDLSGLKADDNHPIALDGEWEFYWNEFLDLKEIENKREKQFLKVPGNWVGHNSVGFIDTYSGYATYHTKIKLPDKNKIYSLKLPTFIHLIHFI